MEERCWQRKMGKRRHKLFTLLRLVSHGNTPPGNLIDCLNDQEYQTKEEEN